MAPKAIKNKGDKNKKKKNTDTNNKRQKNRTEDAPDGGDGGAMAGRKRGRSQLSAEGFEESAGEEASDSDGDGEGEEDDEESRLKAEEEEEAKRKRAEKKKEKLKAMKVPALGVRCSLFCYFVFRGRGMVPIASGREVGKHVGALLSAPVRWVQS